MSTATATKLLTAEEFVALPELHDRRRELVRGEIVEVSKPTFEHGEVAGNTYLAIKQFLKQTPLGRVSVESGFILERGPDTVRGPDVSYYAADRVPLTGRINRLPDQPPDLCVEVISPSNTRGKVRDKLKEYFFAGVRSVWLIDPEERSVTVFHAPDDSYNRYDGQQLDDQLVLPGFTCQVADLFA